MVMSIFICMFVCVPYACSTYRGQKRESDSLMLELIDSCKVIYGYWESKPVPRQEQPVFLNHEPFLHTNTPAVIFLVCLHL